MKLIKQLDIVALLLWCILSFNLIENVNSHYYPCLDSIEGPVIYPNSTQFPPLIIDQNIRVNYIPSVLVYAINNDDVQKAVTCAIESGTDIVPRSGGHSYEKYGLGGRDNVIVLDVSFINVVTVNSKKKSVRIGAGNRLGDVYNKLNQAGFMIPAGSCPSVGIGGHALGGGVGYFSRKYGLACDHIDSMEMVNAKGKLLKIDSKQHPDLFFALRGAGGGSYGIVTYFEFRIHPKPKKITYINLEFNRTDMTQVRQLFYAFNIVGPSLADDFGLKLRLKKDLLSISGVYLGPRKRAKKAMRKFLNLAPDPIESRYTRKTFIESVETLSNLTKYDVFSPKHNPNFFKVKSFYFNTGKVLNKKSIKALVNYVNRANCSTLASFDLYGGAINNGNYYNTSFIHRDALYCLQLEANWKCGELSEQECKEKSRQCTIEINRFGKMFQSKFTSPFSYQGYIDRELDDWQEKYYGGIFERLMGIKREYDYYNLFNFPQSIPVI